MPIPFVRSYSSWRSECSCNLSPPQPPVIAARQAAGGLRLNSRPYLPRSNIDRYAPFQDFPFPPPHRPESNVTIEGAFLRNSNCRLPQRRVYNGISYSGTYYCARIVCNVDERR